MAIAISFIIYCLIIFAITAVGFYRTKTHADYVLGGRHLGGVVTAMGVGASDMSSWLMLGLPGAIYAAGLSEIWLPVGLLIGAYLNWLFVAKRLRIYTDIANDSLTIPAYFENRFIDSSHEFRIIIAAIILLFFTFYSAAGFVGGGLLFSISFNIPYIQGLWICVLVVVIYTALGGFFAINWIDLFQGLLMLFALIILPVMAFWQLGGVQETISRVSQLDLNYNQVLAGVTPIGLVSLLGWGLGYFGQPHILVRFMAAQTAHNIATARRVCMSWMFLSLLGAVAVGFVGIAFFAGAPLDNPETVFLEMTKTLLFVWLAGIFLAAVLSAVMSTVSAQLLACSSVLAEDGYRALLRKSASQKELIWVGRSSVLLVTAVAFWLAYDPQTTILALVAYAWAGLGATFGPPIIISLFWQRMTKQGALLGMLLGAACVIAWE